MSLRPISNGMDIRIKTTDYEMTPEVSAYLDERIASIQKHLGSEADHTRCEVEIGRAAGGQKHGANMWFAEFSLVQTGSNSGRIHATNHASSVNAAIDDVKEEVLAQLRTQKETSRRDLRKGGAEAKRMMQEGAEE